jgi:hypothetical protein
MAVQRLTEVKKKTNEPKDSRFTDLRKPKKQKESGTRLRGH